MLSAVIQKSRKTNISEPRIGPNLRELLYSPDTNPLIDPHEITVKRRRVKTGNNRSLVDPITGELHGVAAIYTVEDKDDAEFVKVFSDGVKAAFGLSKTASRVFHIVLDQYQSTPMHGGYADSVYLAWFDGGLSGQSIGMTDRTFQTGLKELLAKGFLAPRSPNLFWVNPALFFKGDRVAFVKEYRRQTTAHQLQNGTADMLNINTEGGITRGKPIE
jgi:hypothetical protein